MTARTLVVHTGGIGDFLLALPAIAKLDSPIELLGRPERLALAVEAGIAEAAHDIDATEFHTLLAEPTKSVRATLDRFDRAILWMRDSDGALERAMRNCGIGDVRVFSGLPDATWNTHTTEYYAHCLEVVSDPNFRLTFEPNGDHDVIIHPGSGSREKNWPLDRFTALAQILTDRGRRVKWCLGPAELERMPEMRALAPALPPCSLVDLARALSGTRLYIGNDSGITHLAGTVGCPTIAIFGPTDPRVWAPCGEHVRVIHQSVWPQVDDVLESILAS